MKTKIWWLDTTDIEDAKTKVEVAKNSHLSDWEFIRFNETAYLSPDTAALELMVLMTAPPTFSTGKVISCHEIPLRRASDKHQAKFLALLSDIPENVLLLIMARLDRVCALYKALLSERLEGVAVVEESVVLDRNNIVKWIQAKAAKIKLTIDPAACDKLGDQAELNPGRICNELRKLKAFSHDGHVSGMMVDAVAFGLGSMNVFSLGKALLARNEAAAHEMLQRMLDHGEDPEGMCAILHDWLLKLCFAESCGRDYAVALAACKDINKWKKDKERNPDGSKKIDRVNDESSWGRFLRESGESVPMFGNPKAIEHACKDLKWNNVRSEWPYLAYKKLGELNLALRKGGKIIDPARRLHLYVSEMIECQR